MTNLRGRISTAALAGLLGLTLTACGTSTDTGSAADPTAAASTAPADPNAALAASLKGIQQGDYAFALATPGPKAKGAVHLPSKSGAVKLEEKTKDYSFSMELVGTDTERWFRFDSSEAFVRSMFGSDGKTWKHIDTAKIGKDGALDLDVTNADLLGLAGLVKAVTDAKVAGSTITGTIDATKAVTADSFLDEDVVKSMGAAASSVPFTATLDDQGRLTKLVLDAPKADDTPAGKWAYTISGYGAQKAQGKPTGAIKEITAEELSVLNG
ncbi:hypothetical protein BJ973_007964 [Actinoplanes tereljensis]|uniref:Lipoprotein n=1 Tax=Paractinoplanes tereljensis TaxID=571912 RepID=A0A919TXS0_9ACTN|nr:hypothetical protein [Actinoplanes tereljensis]GIF24485.1 hypothetical protein Ate02nite_72150 [Actinoplanes tereljensis]